jgi:hypothetical protein
LQRWALAAQRDKAALLELAGLRLGESVAAAQREREAEEAQRKEAEALAERIKLRAQKRLAELAQRLGAAREEGEAHARAAAQAEAARLAEAAARAQLQDDILEQRRASQVAALQLARSRDECAALRRDVALKLSDLERSQVEMHDAADEFARMQSYAEELEHRLFESQAAREAAEERLAARQDSLAHVAQELRISQLERASFKDSVASAIDLRSLSRQLAPPARTQG